jgi:hypothetical protein
MIFSLVPLVQLLQSSAGVLGAIVTKLRVGLAQQFTIDYDAFFAVLRFSFAIDPATFAVIFFAKIAQTYSAIHSTGRYQSIF